jgi:hypothetical protein
MRKTLLYVAIALLVQLPLFGAVKTTPARSSERPRHLRTHLKTRNKHWRLRRVFIPWSPVRGSRESLLRQNERTDGLERIQDDDQLNELTQNGSLVELPVDDTVGVAGNLPEERRYCRSWTKTFVSDFARDYYEQFHQPLVVTSAVRTVAVQKKLRRHNHNAAEIDGDAASPHLTGATIDIGKRGMTKKQLEWCREYLLEQQNRGTIDAEEEFRQRVFHITVYKDYDLSKVRDAAAPDAEVPPAEAPVSGPASVLDPAVTPVTAPAATQSADNPR